MKDFVQVRVECAAFGATDVHVAELSGKEQISRLFELELRLVTLAGGLDEDALLTTPIVIVFERRPEDGGSFVEIRRIPGMICAIRDRALGETKHREYIVTVVPRAWQATLTKTSDLCMDMTVPAIIQKKLADVGLVAGTDVVLRLKHTYPSREFVVQYQESHWAFVSRLAEDLGIHFSFEEKDGGDVIVFGDDNGAFTPAEPAKSPFAGRGDHTDVYELEARRQIVSKSFVARDYNYRNPSMEVLGQATTGALSQGSVDEYGPHAKTPDEATYYAKMRAEEAATRSFVFEGKSDLPGLRAGSQLTVEGHPRGDLDMIVTEVVHDVAQPVFGAGANARPYRNTFRATRKGVPFRPARITPKPIVHGVVTGIVESASATKLGAIDDQGRYRVSLMFDAATDRAAGKGSRPLRMAQSSAGSTRGIHAPLTVGTEVLVTCVNGDPDRPIIAGAVSNPQTPSPVTSANAEKSMWKTNHNAIAIDDDKPRLKMTVAGEDHIFQLGQPNAPEEGIVQATTKNSTSVTNGTMSSVSKEQNEHSESKTTITKDSTIAVAGVPSPMDWWKEKKEKVEKYVEYAKQTAELAKFTFETVSKAVKIEKKDADEKLAKAVHAQQVARAKQPPDPEAVAEATKEALEAMEAAEKANEASEQVEGFEKWAKESPLNLDTTKEGLAAQVVAKEAGLAIAHAEKLLSKASAEIAKHAGEVAMKLMKTWHVGARSVTVASGQRIKADTGKFDDPCNIQMGRNSVGIMAGKNAFVGASLTTGVMGGKHVTVTGGEHAHIKAGMTVEASAKSVLLTGKTMVDIYGHKLVGIVADEKTASVPGGASMLLLSRKNLEMGSIEDSIHVKAKKNISLFAENDNVTVTAKKDMLLAAQDGKYELKAKGDILIDSANARFTILAKTAGRITTQEEFDLLAKKDATLKTDAEMKIVTKKDFGVKSDADINLKSKAGSWKTSGDLDIKASNVNLKGSKINLG